MFYNFLLTQKFTEILCTFPNFGTSCYRRKVIRNRNAYNYLRISHPRKHRLLNPNDYFLHDWFHLILRLKYREFHQRAHEILYWLFQKIWISIRFPSGAKHFLFVRQLELFLNIHRIYCLLQLLKIIKIIIIEILISQSFEIIPEKPDPFWVSVSALSSDSGIKLNLNIVNSL